MSLSVIRALQALFQDGFWESDHDFLKAFHTIITMFKLPTHSHTRQLLLVPSSFRMRNARQHAASKGERVPAVARNERRKHQTDHRKRLQGVGQRGNVRKWLLFRRKFVKVWPICRWAIVVLARKITSYHIISSHREIAKKRLLNTKCDEPLRVNYVRSDARIAILNVNGMHEGNS